MSITFAKRGTKNAWMFFSFLFWWDPNGNRCVLESGFCFSRCFCNVCTAWEGIVGVKVTWGFIMSCHVDGPDCLILPRCSSKCIRTNKQFLYVKSNRLVNVSQVKDMFSACCHAYVWVLRLDWATGRKSKVSPRSSS